MKPVKFPESNKVYTKPVDMSDDECVSLEVYETEKMKISCWEFTPTERLHAIFFNKVWVSVYQNTLPPFFLSPEFPFREDAKGIEPEPIEKIVERFLERKVKQFIAQEKAKTEDLTAIAFLESQYADYLLTEFTKFFAGVKDE